jgi:predicted metalloprotease with PDZ domain
VILGLRRSSVPEPCQNLFSEANARLAAAAESRKLAEEAMQRGDEKEASSFFDEEKWLRQLAEESRAKVEEEIREGKIAGCPPSGSPGSKPNANRYQFGLSVAPLTAQLADYFNAATDGMLITEARAGDLGARAGLKAGDCIVTVNGKAIKSASDLDRLLDQEKSDELEFLIVRDRNERKVKIKPDQK